MTRHEADRQVIRLINAATPELELLMIRLRNDGFVSKVDEATLQEVKRLLEEAAGRLMLRTQSE